MSQPTPEMIRAGFDAFNRRDIETWLATFAEHIRGCLRLPDRRRD
jgi:hypothetical protein